MFKNPLKYQQGGQLNQEQQQMLAAFIDWLPKRVKEFEGMQPEAIVQALDGMSKTPEGQRQVQAYVEQFQNEMNGITSNKLGGKIQDFICKHAKGGHVGCGCKQDGDIVKSQNGNPALGLNFIQREYDGDGNAVYFLAPEKRFLPVNMRQDPDSDYQQQGGEYQGNGQVSIVDFGNRMRINKDPYGPFGDVAHGADSAAIANRALELMKKIGMKPSNGFVQSKQEGGELTRREALDAGMQNKDYNRSQARFALRNAKNTLRNAGVRGREMRQTARQWVAGQTEEPKSIVLSAPSSINESLPAAQPMNYPTQHNESLANLPFNEAFGRARRAGAQTFWWPRGRYKVYNTELGTSGDQANGTGNSAEMGATPNLPVIDTNFNIPDIVIDESTIPQVTLNLADTTPVVNIPGIPEPIVQSAQESAIQPTTESSQPNNSNYFVQEYLRTHFPNGSRRNVVSRWIYGQQRNLIGEQSPLFIGPTRPGTTQGR